MCLRVPAHVVVSVGVGIGARVKGSVVCCLHRGVSVRVDVWLCVRGCVHHVWT